MNSTAPASSAPSALRSSAEFVLLFLVVLAPWPFASVQPFWEFVLTAGVAVLLALWAADAALARQFHFRPDVVSVSLAALVLLSFVQLVPLPVGVVRVISPGAVAIHEEFRPELRETLPGEGVPEPRAQRLTLSVDAEATRTFAARVTVLLVLYTVVRNWLACPAALRRLAWVATVNGLALAVFGLAQFFSSEPGIIFWARDVGGAVFGPFVNRNHFCDYIAGCLGLGVGLLLTLRQDRPGDYRTAAGPDWLAPLRYLDQPWPLAAAGAVALMMAGVLFSLSRGGVLGLAVAGVACILIALGKSKPETETSRIGGWALGIAVVLTVALVGWFGWEPIQARFATLLKAKQADDRTELWRESLRAANGFWLMGSGSGSFVRVETLGRKESAASVSYDHAHNEYVEALVEGGAMRLVLMLVLIGAVLLSVGRAFRRTRGQPGNTLLLGAWFGLAAVAAHAVTDFGIHLPAVALFTTVLAGYALAHAQMQPDEPTRTRRKVRVRVRVDAKAPPVSPAPAVVPPAPLPAKSPPNATVSMVLAVLLLLTGFVLAWDSWVRWRSDELRIGAEAFRNSAVPNRVEGRLAYAQARAQLRPGDPAAWLDLAQVHLDNNTPSERLAAAAALRTARDRCPLYPEVQFRLGLVARSFATAEPALAYFQRAKRLLAVDADVWFACGLEALREQDEATAWESFRQSLALSRARLKPILSEAGKRLSPERIVQAVLPDEPALAIAAAEQLFPNAAKQAAQRKPFLEQAARARDNRTTHPESLVAAARALGELERPGDAEATWRRAVELAPERIEYRDAFARWLETEERYAAAIEQLEALLDRRPLDASYRDRLLIAKHAAELQAILGR